MNDKGGCIHDREGIILKEWLEKLKEELRQCKDYYANVSQNPSVEVAGKKKPEKSELDSIFEKHDRKYGSKEEWLEVIKKDLIDWKYPKDSGGQSEEPKTLWEILYKVYYGRFPENIIIDNIWQRQAKAALDWVEEILPEVRIGDSFGWNVCLNKIRKRLSEERGK